MRYEPGLSRNALRPAARSSDEILLALNEGRVALALQPIVEAFLADTGCTAAHDDAAFVEALLAWADEQVWQPMARELPYVH